MRVSIITYPGSNCDQDAIHAWSRILGAQVAHIWHKDTDLQNPDLVFIPGGFSYGDYLRCGAIAQFSPVMAEVKRFYQSGGYLFGVCNGFQILCEMGILPGSLLTNQNLRFICQDVFLRVENNPSPFTAGLSPGRVLRCHIAHGMGQYFADNATLDQLAAEECIAFRYSDANGRLSAEANPNGSAGAIAGITSRDGRVLGMMPHPERLAEEELGNRDGALILAGIMSVLTSAR